MEFIFHHSTKQKNFQIFNSKKIPLPNQRSTSVVLYVLRADGVLAGHAVYNVHAVPMTGNNADGSGGDLFPNAGLEMKKNTNYNLLDWLLVVRGSIWQGAQKKLFAALL